MADILLTNGGKYENAFYKFMISFQKIFKPAVKATKANSENKFLTWSNENSRAFSSFERRSKIKILQRFQFILR